MRAWWKSGSAVVPSPTTPEAMHVSPLMAAAMAQPTAWMYWVPRLPEIEKKPASRTEYMTGICRPCSRSFSLEKIWHIISTSGQSLAISQPCWRYVGKNMSRGPARALGRRRTPPPRCSACRTTSCPGAAPAASDRHRRASSPSPAVLDAASRRRSAAPTGPGRGRPRRARGMRSYARSRISAGSTWTSGRRTAPASGTTT